MNKLEMFEIVEQRDVLDIRDEHTDMKKQETIPPYVATLF